MKKQIILSFCTVLLLATPGYAQVSDTTSSPWKIYTVKDGRFSVALPTLPAVDVKHRYFRNTQEKRLEILVGAYADGVVYTIYVVEKFGQSLDDFIREQIGNYSSRFTSERNLTRNGRSGKQFHLASSFGSVEFFISDDRIYKINVLGASPDDARVTKFFDSLSFGRKSAGAIEAKDGPGLPYEPVVQPGAAEDEITNRLYTGREVDTKARLATKPEPVYTDAARRAQVTGTVVMKCVFASNGMVRNIVVVSGLPHGLTEQAIDAARKIKFVPAKKNGKFVSVWMQLEYNFNLY